jgi:hypothetical protein
MLGDLDAVRELAALGEPGRGPLAALWLSLLDHGGPVDLTWLLGYGAAPGGGRHGKTEALTELVLRPEPEVLTAEMKPVLVAAAGINTHPVGEIARRKVLAAGSTRITEEVCRLGCLARFLGEFCHEHGLAPADPDDRLWFLLCTERYEQVRAELRAEAGDGSGGVRKGVGRGGAGGHGVDGGAVRRLVATGWNDDSGYRMGAPFLDFGAWLAGRADWPRLWRLAGELPADLAHELVALFPSDWRPPTDRGRAYYEALIAIDRLDLFAAKLDPSLVYEHRLDERAFAVAVSPDGSRLAYARWTPRSGDRDRRRTELAVMDPRTGERVMSRLHTQRWTRVRLVFCGPGVLLCADDSGLHAYVEGGAHTVLEEAPISDLAVGGTRYAAATDSHLLTGTGGQPPDARIDLRELGLPIPAPDRAAGKSRLWTPLAVSADGRQIAVGSNEALLVVDPSGHVLSRLSPGVRMPRAVAFLGAERLVLAGSYASVRVLRRDAGWGPSTDHPYDAVGVGILPASRQIVVMTDELPAGIAPSRLRVLDEETLSPVGHYVPPVSAMSVPPGSDLLATVTPGSGPIPDTGTVTLRNLRRLAPLALLFEPAHQLHPRDLRRSPPSTEPVFRLLRARFAYLFGT